MLNEIPDAAYYPNYISSDKNIKIVVLTSSLTKIDSCAFFCIPLEGISLQKSIFSIGLDVFSSTKLKGVFLSNDVNNKTKNG